MKGQQPACSGLLTVEGCIPTSPQHTHTHTHCTHITYSLSLWRPLGSLSTAQAISGLHPHPTLAGPGWGWGPRGRSRGLMRRAGGLAASRWRRRGIPAAWPRGVGGWQRKWEGGPRAAPAGSAGGGGPRCHPQADRVLGPGPAATPREPEQVVAEGEAAGACWGTRLPFSSPRLFQLPLSFSSLPSRSVCLPTLFFPSLFPSLQPSLQEVGTAPTKFAQC